MIFTPTGVRGAFIIDSEVVTDERGGFARVWCASEWAAHGLDSRLSQCSSSTNRRKGTLRGLHYQVAPHEEAKFVRCIRGAIYDVVLDLRTGGETFRCWASAQLTAENRRGVFIPAGCAHGFQTLEEDTEVMYFVSARYQPAAGRGVRWNDPAFAIAWPLADPILSDRDRHYEDFA